MERRKHQRHEVSAPVRFEWEESIETRQGTGVTRDLSAEGVFIMTEDTPPVGATVHFEVDLDTSQLDSAVSVRAKGQVSRIGMPDLAGQLGGFAVSARRMRLEKLGTPTR